MASKSPEGELWKLSMNIEVQGHLTKHSLVNLPLPVKRPYTVKGKWARVQTLTH